MGLWCLLSLLLECVTCGGGWVVLQCGLNLSNGHDGSAASWEMQAKDSHNYALSGDFWHELQSYMHMAATYAGLGGAQKRPSCEPMPAAGSARFGATLLEVQSMWRPSAALLRDFRKVWGMSQDRPFVWKYHWKQLGWAHKLGGVGSQEVTRAGQKVIADLWRLRHGSHQLALWRKGSAKKPKSLCQHYCLGETRMPGLVLMPHNLVPPHLSLVPFKLLPQH